MLHRAVRVWTGTLLQGGVKAKDGTIVKRDTDTYCLGLDPRSPDAVACRSDEIDDKACLDEPDDLQVWARPFLCKLHCHTLEEAVHLAAENSLT